MGHHVHDHASRERTVSVRTRSLLVALIALVAAGSCDSCAGDRDLAREFGTLNPLFDRVTFQSIPGRVINPDPAVDKRFRVELVLAVEEASIAEDDVRAFGGDFEAIEDPPLDLATTGLESIPIRDVASSTSAAAPSRSRARSIPPRSSGIAASTSCSSSIRPSGASSRAQTTSSARRCASSSA
jgi:hypothetical protein